MHDSCRRIDRLAFDAIDSAARAGLANNPEAGRKADELFELFVTTVETEITGQNLHPLEGKSVSQRYTVP